MFLTCMCLFIGSLTTLQISVYANASEGEKNDSFETADSCTLGIKDIPIYFTKISNYNEQDISIIKESSLAEIKESIKSKSNDLSRDKENNYLHISKKGYEIFEVEESLKANIVNDPLYKSIFESLNELIDNGVKVNYVNIYVKENPRMTSRNNNLDDPAYWESQCQYLGSYNGYKFLYLESATNVESSWVTPGNIDIKLKWDEITKSSIEALADHYVKGVYYKTARAAYSALSTLFSSFESPLSITYSESGGYVKAKVSGDLYSRTILIRDKKDRIPGYAYYNWGSTQQFKAYMKVDAKWPVRKRPGGTYEYHQNQETYGPYYSNTPGFYGNTTLYQSIISLYENTQGYFTHVENIDVHKIIANLLKN